MSSTNRNQLFLLSFIEGGAVMACELIGAKLLAPFFGTSLYVWAAALGLTLGGLTLGYFIGGRLSQKYPTSKKLLYLVLIVAGILLSMMPFVSEWIMNLTINLELETGAILSLSFFMLPPLMFMGMVSPIIINLLTNVASSAGNNAGNVYAISTLGGILMTFMMGFYVIPTFGLTIPAIVTGIVLAIIPLTRLLLATFKLGLIGAILIVVASSLSLLPKNNYNEDYKIIYQSEGILGQIKVVDHPSYEITPDNRIGRGLIVNNTLQTFVGLDHDLQYSIWGWAHYFPTAASIFPPNSEVLLLGLGGGTIVKQMESLSYNTDVVEIDKRIRDISFDFFNLNRETNIYIDDARHFIRTSKKKYDIIIFDTFLSEAVPEHLVTIEGFEDTKKILNPGGMIMINFYGFTDGEKGIASRSVYKTLNEVGFKTEVLATPGSEETRNLIFLASLEEKDFSQTRYDEPNFDEIKDLYIHFLQEKSLNSGDARILSDKKPQLARLYTKAAKEWKKSYNAYYEKHFRLQK